MAESFYPYACLILVIFLWVLIWMAKAIHKKEKHLFGGSIILTIATIAILILFGYKDAIDCVYMAIFMSLSFMTACIGIVLTSAGLLIVCTQTNLKS